jgi:hypothetical protein
MKTTTATLSILLLSSLPIAGCQSPFLPTPAERRANDEAVCRDYGFKQGTDGFANCLMQQDRDRQERREREWDRDAIRLSHPSDGGMQAPKIAPMPHMCTPYACYN